MVHDFPNDIDSPHQGAADYDAFDHADINTDTIDNDEDDISEDNGNDKERIEQVFHN